MLRNVQADVFFFTNSQADCCIYDLGEDEGDEKSVDNRRTGITNAPNLASQPPIPSELMEHKQVVHRVPNTINAESFIFSAIAEVIVPNVIAANIS